VKNHLNCHFLISNLVRKKHLKKEIDQIQIKYKNKKPNWKKFIKAIILLRKLSLHPTQNQLIFKVINIVKLMITSPTQEKEDVELLLNQYLHINYFKNINILLNKLKKI